jgi:hypothetical protein
MPRSNVLSFRKSQASKVRVAGRIAELTFEYVWLALLPRGARSPPGVLPTHGGSHAASDLRIAGPDPDGRLFPITRRDELLAHWIQFGWDSFGTVWRAPIDSVFPTQRRV